MTVSKPETNKYRGTATSLHTSSATTSLSTENKCDICRWAGHDTEQCYILKYATIAERKLLLRAVHLCFKCLKPHMSY